MSADFKYDAFISYKHGGADEAFAREVLWELESAGFTVAIDERDFEAGASFLDEMERCIKESRFTLALVSGRYLKSGDTMQEGIIAKVLDMSDRKRRLIPLITEQVETPTWMYALTGINFTKENPIVPPFQKLKETLHHP